ncbi:MAG: hypothetical protein ACFFB3_06585 [Candidatus Hodarchaeota archaeon]
MDQFTKEELEILGEDMPDEDPGTPSEEESDTGESQESEEKPEAIPESEEKEEADTEQKHDEGETDKDRVPYDRFSKVYGEKKELEWKLELFRTDPEEYFRQYPDEKPSEERSEEPETKIPTFGEAGNLVVQGGEHDGLTLRQVYEKDPFAAQDIYMQYKEDLLAKQRQEQETVTRLQEESNQEINSFAIERAKELFNKSDDFNLRDLNEKEVDQINKEIQDVLQWMDKTGRGGGKLKDAYVLKNLGTILENATKKGASGLINHLKKPSSSSISSKRTSSDRSMENYINMDPNQLAAMIDDMSDQQFLNFRKNAPPALREKLPMVDWG